MENVRSIKYPRLKPWHSLLIETTKLQVDTDRVMRQKLHTITLKYTNPNPVI